MSPAARSASARSRMTRARPSTVPAETGKPTSAPAGTSSRRYAPAMPSPSDVGPHEALGFLQQGLLVHEVAADHAVLRILPVPTEGPDPVDHPLRLGGLLLPVRQGPQ